MIPRSESGDRWGRPPRGLGARSVTSVALFVLSVGAVWQMGLVRADYWAQLSPWVPFLVGGFAVMGGTLAFRYWRLGERSEYYFRLGELHPFGGETALGRSRGSTLVIGHAPHIERADFPPVVQHLLYIGIASCIALITLTNRAVALLREVPASFDKPSKEYCAEPEVAKPAAKTPRPGCKLVRRAYELGYTKKLGACATDEVEQTEAPAPVCTKRQRDEPYLHYEWRLLESRTQALVSGDDAASDGLGDQLEYLGTLMRSTADAIAMQPRSSHHLFTNLPDPRRSLLDRLRSRGSCIEGIAHLAHFPQLSDPSALLQHVLAKLLHDPIYKPVISDCREVIVHWGAPLDACEQLAKDPRAFLGDALDGVVAVLEARRTRVELAKHTTRRMQPGELATAQRIASFQCLIVGDVESASPEDRSAVIDGETFTVREARTKTLTTDGASQIRLYKQLSALLAEAFGYGRLTSNQAVGARPEEAAIAGVFREPAFLLTKLELLRDADLFLGNEWLAKRPDLLDVYPYHLHLQTFVEIFRRQYRLHRGRL